VDAAWCCAKTACIERFSRTLRCDWPALPPSESLNQICNFYQNNSSCLPHNFAWFSHKGYA
jgi:hypothetical protein